MTAFTKSLVAMAIGIAVVAMPSAEAATTSNGLSRNGVSANGLSRNGLSRNGLSRNGLSRNGLSRNGLSRNGSWLKGCYCDTAIEQDSMTGNEALRVVGIELPR